MCSALLVGAGVERPAPRERVSVARAPRAAGRGGRRRRAASGVRSARRERSNARQVHVRCGSAPVMSSPLLFSSLLVSFMSLMSLPVACSHRPLARHIPVHVPVAVPVRAQDVYSKSTV